MQGPYAGVEYKYTTCATLQASRHVHDHQNTAHKTGTILKRHQWAIPSFSLVVWQTIVPFSLYDALWREAEALIAKQTDQADTNLDATREWKLGVLQTCPFND